MARRPRCWNGLAPADTARRGGPAPTAGDDQCGVAGAGRCARAGCGNTVRARRPCRRRGGDRRQPGGSRQRRWPGPGVLLWRCRRSRAERATHARIVCTFLDGVFTSRGPSVGTLRARRCRIRVAVSGALGRRSLEHHRTGI
ncbi:hypothetical protein NCGM2209_1851 [Mycobacterium tuberculosis NCGM2209]|nr:hypothetical protein NCGM2209_1851 [Mycobacterium tuberculosis NCGM2209]